jgi:hypothetical protein
MYLESASLAKLKQDVAGFIAGAMKSKVEVKEQPRP